MKIGIIGPGAVGLLFAYYLQRQTHAVTIYTRTKEQADQLLQDGVMCIRGNEHNKVFPNAKPLESAKLDDDYLFVAVKQYQLEQVLPYLYNSAATCILFLQNGMSHLPILHNMQSKKVAVGIVEHGVKKESSTIVRHTGMGATRLGIVSGTKRDFRQLELQFCVHQFPVHIEDNWKSTLTNKIIVNACINPLTALYKVCNGELLDNVHFQLTMKQVLQEVLLILNEENAVLQWERVCGICRSTADNHSSMLMDVLEERPTEVDAILGYLLAEARIKNIPTPIVSFLYHSIKGLER